MKNLGNKNNVINASEIGQYKYCSVGWFLQKKGYKPDSVYLSKGLEKHRELGLNINRVEKKQKKSNIFKIISYIFLVLGILMIVLEVI
jgi:hypothetical protein